MNVTTANSHKEGCVVFARFSHDRTVAPAPSELAHPGCYRRDAARLLALVAKPLNRLVLGDLQSFAQSLVEDGLAPISQARTLAAVKSLFGF
jgi:hypothetical protein